MEIIFHICPIYFIAKSSCQAHSLFLQGLPGWERPSLAFNWQSGMLVLLCRPIVGSSMAIYLLDRRQHRKTFSQGGDNKCLIFPQFRTPRTCLSSTTRPLTTCAGIWWQTLRRSCSKRRAARCPWAAPLSTA